jgi:CBS domain-containing protein
VSNIRARDVMTTPVVTVDEDLLVETLLGRLREARFSAFPVVDVRGRAVGIVSQNDVLRALAYGVGPGYVPLEFQKEKRRAATRLLHRNPTGGPDRTEAVTQLLGRHVRDIMTPALESCREDTPVEHICEVLTLRRIHRLVVVDGEGRVIGIISSLDLVRRLGAEIAARPG